jgi:TonB family protein
MTAIRGPILLSMGLHCLFAVVLAVAPLGAKGVLEPRQEITIDLIEAAATPPAVEPADSPVRQELSSPVIRHALKRDPQPAQHPSRAIHTGRLAKVAHTNAQTAALVSRPAPVLSASRSLAAAIEPVPSFIEMPRSFHLAGPPAVMPDAEGVIFPTDMISSVSALPTTGIVPSLNRPVLTARAGLAQVFRDTSPERMEAIRSKAKPGHNVRPEYPRTAREAGWEGTVMLRVEVLPDGKAGLVSVHQTSGYAILDHAALTAVQRWRFSPAMDGNFPVHSVVHLPVRFDLTAP